MGIIRQLPEALSNQIAAGEVVERPSSVVKELVENAIDAESTLIHVELKEAGIQSIKVTDNGSGMVPDDIKMSMMPHATSKVWDINDLFNIQTLGFRGEALASIASVSKLTIQSTPQKALGNPQGSIGYYIRGEGSQLLEEGNISHNPGTSIIVESLFFNTPARLKHLKSLQTELRHTVQFMQQITLAYPHIRFSLSNDGTNLFQSFGGGDLRQTIAQIYQPSVAKELIRLEGSDDDFRIFGYVSPPNITRTSKHYIHWLINGRVVKSFILSQVLLKAYGRQLMIGRYPIAVIHIQLDPQLVDVNVHPTKQTVRLSKEEELSKLLLSVINEALNRTNTAPQFEASNHPNNIRPTFEKSVMKATGISKDSQVSNPHGWHVPHREASPSNNLREQISLNISNQRDEEFMSMDSKGTRPSNIISKVSYENSYHLEETTDIIETPLKKNQDLHNKPKKISFMDLRYVGQIHGTYLIAEHEDGFYLIDQHAAQERERYERLMKREPNIFDQQLLLMPIIIQLSKAEAMILEEYQEKFEELGLFLSLFGESTYQLESYPQWMTDQNIEKMIKDMIDLIQTHQDLTINQILEKSIIMQSCRGAIKANHHLSDKEATALIRQMANLEDPYHCPHGRPVFIDFTHRQLEKLFKRIQDSHLSGHQI